MKKALSLSILLTVLLFTASAKTHEKVVVVPLGNSQNPSVIGDPWIRIYDNNDVFVGFSYGGNIVVSSKNYFTKLSIISGDVYQPIPYFYFTSPTCTDNPYMKPFYDVFSYGPGMVTANGYSIPRNATLITIPAGNYYDNGCNLTPLASPIEVYQTLPNNPTITGIQSRVIPGPLKAIYTSPSPP